jgi:hypothetical protein|tara:strand:+ start:108 stop:539 length:432 start_codon:yes stop_codon:yes gene_type:complete
MYEIIIALFVGMAVWLPIYKYYISRLVGDHVVKRVESKDIDLTYLLDTGGVFDALADRVVTLFKHHMLAEMGTLTRSAKAMDPENMDPLAMGLDSADQLLKMVGMKKAPPILQYKVAQALGQLVDQQNSGAEPFLDPNERFGP